MDGKGRLLDVGRGSEVAWTADPRVADKLCAFAREVVVIVHPGEHDGEQWDGAGIEGWLQGGNEERDGRWLAVYHREDDVREDAKRTLQICKARAAESDDHFLKVSLGQVERAFEDGDRWQDEMLAELGEKERELHELRERLRELERELGAQRLTHGHVEPVQSSHAPPRKGKGVK